MRKKILCGLIGLIIGISCVGCACQTNPQKETLYDGNFTIITKDSSYIFVYANDTKVKYLIVKGSYGLGITPLFNSDGTLQTYEGN